ncbi:MAG: hypothetical protein QHH04_04585 [Methanolinea sp.]|jgi:hypothetical protein|nr:hypothetical protein [Methanolinea sp.]
MDLSFDRRIAPLLPLILLVVPLNLYVIGDWLGSGVQWALFRYQETFYGPSLITVASDTGYVSSGLIAGRTAVSFILWDAGAVILVVSFLVILLAVAEGKVQWIRYAGVAVAVSGVLLVASCIVQYGPLFAGPAGFSVPIGIPLVFAAAWILFAGEWSEGDDGDGEDSG